MNSNLVMPTETIHPARSTTSGQLMLNVDFSEHRLRQIGFWVFSPKDFAQPEQ